MSAIARTNRHVDPFGLAHREFDAVFGHLMGSNDKTPRLNPVDVRETVDGFVVEAELPGFTKEQVDITLENNVLTLVADRTEKAETRPETPVSAEEPALQANVGYHLRERRSVRFERNFKLPATINESSIDARLEHGILTVKIAKRPETKPRKIAVA